MTTTQKRVTPPAWFVLTDGWEVFEARRYIRSEAELQDKQHEAYVATDGNVWWVPEDLAKGEGND